MPVPVYPTILTKIDWDANKGTIGKAPNELGIGSAVAKAQGDFQRVDWNVLNNATFENLKKEPKSVITNLPARLQEQDRQARTASDSLLQLADVTGSVVSRYERAATFPKPLIEHVRKMKEAALQLVRTISNSTLDGNSELAKKIKGFSRLQELKFDAILDSGILSFHFLTWARGTAQCDFEFQFLLDTHCVTRQQIPRGQQALDIYNKYIKNREINIQGALCEEIEGFQTKNELANPPAPSFQPLLKAWKEAYGKAKVMFVPGGVYRDFQAQAFANDNRILLCPELQV